MFQQFAMLKNFGLLVAVALFIATGDAQAQVVARPWYYPQGGGGYGYGFASTAAEGRARGAADVIRATGENRYYTSAAAINAQDAASKYIDNRVKWQQAYYEMRRTYRSFAEEEREKKAKSRDAWLEAGGAYHPDRLSASQLDPVTGDISWPAALKGQEFSAYRQEIEGILNQRSDTGSGSDDLHAATEKLLGELKKHIREMSPQSYIAARKFVDSLKYESQLPAG